MGARIIRPGAGGVDATGHQLGQRLAAAVPLGGGVTYKTITRVGGTAIGSGGSSIPFGYPAIANLDVAVLFVSSYSGGPLVATPTGYTPLDMTTGVGGYGIRGTSFYRVLNGTEGASSVSMVSADTNAKTLALEVYRNVDPALPVADHNVVGSGAGAAGGTTPSLIAVRAGSLYVAGFACESSSLNQTVSASAPLTQRDNITQTTDNSSTTGDQVILAAGATGTRAATSSQLVGCVGMGVLLNPAPA